MFESIDSLKLMGVMIKVDEEVYMNVNDNDWKWMTMEEMEKMKKGGWKWKKDLMNKVDEKRWMILWYRWKKSKKWKEAISHEVSPVPLFSFIIFIMANDLYIEIHVTSEEEVCGIVSVQQFECPIAEVILIVSHRRGDTGLLWSSVARAGGWASKWVEPGGGRHLADDAWPSNLCCEKELAHIQSGWERHVCNQVRRDGATIAVTNSRRSGRICRPRQLFA